MRREYRQTQNPTPLSIDKAEKLREFFFRWSMDLHDSAERAHYVRMRADARHAYGLLFATFLDRCTETNGDSVSIRPEIQSWEYLFSRWVRFQARHVEATYTSLWDGHLDCSARTLVDQRHNRIHTTETAVNAEEADHAHALSEEFVTFDDGASVRVREGRIHERREGPAKSQLSLRFGPNIGRMAMS